MVSIKSRNIVTGLTSLVVALSPLFSSGCKSSTPQEKNRTYAAQSLVTPQKYRVSSQPSKPNNYKTEALEKDSDEVLLARMIFGEARNCRYLEKVGVGYTPVTRANDGKKWNGKTLKEAILKHDEKGVYQYSCFNRGDPSRAVLMDPKKYSPRAFDECLRVSRDILEGKVADPTGGATHYYSPEGMRAIKIHQIERKYKIQIQKLEKKKPNKKASANKKKQYQEKLTLVKKQYQAELKKAKTEEPPKPYWADSMHEIGKIDVGDGELSDHVFYKPK